MKAIKSLSVAFCMFFNSSVFAGEYEDYLFYTSSLNINPTNAIKLQDVHDHSQAVTLLPPEVGCLSNVNEMILYISSKQPVSMTNDAYGCHILKGEWTASDGHQYSNIEELTVIPMWDHEMISRFTDYEDKQTKNALLSKLYSPDNWMIIPTKHFQAISNFFPVNLNSNDVTSCDDLKKFTLFGITNGLRFPRELTDRIISLEQYPECEKFFSLTRESTISSMSESWDESIKYLKSLTGD